MAKISPVSIKYMIHANFAVEGFLEKPDVIGALFGQTEGLLGSDLEMRELQKEGKIGRIEVELEKKEKRTTGKIHIPTALDQSETALIAAAIETIERIGPCDAQIEVERIEDVRGSKRDYIVERAKKLMKDLSGATDSREISTEIRSSTRAADIEEYGDEKLPSGDLSGNEIIVVEGRADVVNLMRNGVSNVIAMNGTKLPRTISDLSLEKDITLFVDGDRGGRLIIQNVVDNAKVKEIAVAPDGKEVEELTGKEILQALRKKMPAAEFLSRDRSERAYPSFNRYHEREPKREESKERKDGFDEKKIEEIFNRIKGTGKAITLDGNLNEIKEVSVKGLNLSLRKSNGVKGIVMDGTATNTLIKTAEEEGCEVLAAKNFTSTDTKMKLMSF